MNIAASDGGKGTVNLTGRRLMDRYVVREKIARGGMGVVFRGEDERLQRPVCVKVFQTLDPSRPEYATILEHFVQEAFTLSRLQHPNTLRIYDFGYLDESARLNPYFITELADAGNLTTLIEQAGPLPRMDALRILEPIVGALREAHDAGVVHRDIKPSNILFTYAGGGPVPKLADFSIAKTTRDLPNRAHDTNASVPLYSLSWAAPEQINEGTCGPQADVFALGLTTAFMLTGQLVYPGVDIIELYAMRSEGPEMRIRSIRELGLPEEIEAVVLQACEEDPAERYPSVEAFYEALEDALQPREPEPARPLAPADPHAGAGWEAQQLHDDHDDDDSMPTERHRAYDLAGLMPLAGTPPPAAPFVRERIEPEVQPQPPRPRLAIASLAAPVVIVGNRRVRLLHVGDEPLLVPDAAGGEPARIRVTPNEVGGARAHLKGLNCFLRPAGGRPSSGLDVNHTTAIDLLAPTMAVKAQVHARIGNITDDAHVFELGEAVLAVPTGLASWVIVLELGGPAGRDALLLFRP